MANSQHLMKGYEIFNACEQARQIAELTAQAGKLLPAKTPLLLCLGATQVSQQQSTIASLRVEVAKKPGSPGTPGTKRHARLPPCFCWHPRQPSAAAGNAEMEAKRRGAPS